MADNDDALPQRGEILTSQWSFKAIDPKRIEKGDIMMPAKIAGEASREYAALNLIHNDLTFAFECFNEAEKLGEPDVSNTQSKALIFSAVVAYARPFMTNVRKVKLKPDFFANMAAGFDLDFHNYLIAVRSKHITHSVNDFERCETAALMLSTPGAGWRVGGAIGVTETQSIGLTLKHIQQAITHVANLRTFLRDDIDRRGVDVYKSFSEQFEKDKVFEPAPIARFPERARAGDRRKD